MHDPDERIAGQRHRIQRLRRAGCHTAASEDMLRLLLETRELMLDHQKLLEREMVEWRTLHRSSFPGRAKEATTKITMGHILTT